MRINPEKLKRRVYIIGEVRPNIVLYLDEVDINIVERLKVIKKDSQLGNSRDPGLDTLLVIGTFIKLFEL